MAAMSVAVQRELLPGADVVTIFTPLGIRFWDAARDVAVTDALEVTAWPQGAPQRRRSAARTTSGVYAFHGLPGLHEVEYPSDTAPLSPPALRRFVVRVDDRRQRFLPVAFAVDAPQFGIYLANLAIAGGQVLPGLYLFSAPTRTAESSMAVLRVQVARDVAGSPAAHAVVEVTGPLGRQDHGIADKNGSAVVMFAYPPFRPDSDALSPPIGAPRSQSWSLRIGVRYSPALLTPVAGTGLPDLRGVLGQAPARLRPTLGSNSLVDAIDVELEFGQQLVVRTTGLPHLIAEAAASPP